MDRFCTTIEENWYNWKPTEVAAYGLWRLNWIHPFIEGNGRTARAASYFLLCVRNGSLLPGKKIIPERIRENRAAYEEALQKADSAWVSGDLDFELVEQFIADLLFAQLQDTD
jgi:Fic family protein